MIHKMAEAMEKIDRAMVREWIEDLVLWKIFQGFDVQRVILKKLAEELDASYQLGDSEDESKGIDGYLHGEPVSIKPVQLQGEAPPTRGYQRPHSLLRGIRLQQGPPSLHRGTIRDVPRTLIPL
jgi:hypothetical protein